MEISDKVMFEGNGIDGIIRNPLDPQKDLVNYLSKLFDLEFHIEDSTKKIKYFGDNKYIENTLPIDTPTRKHKEESLEYHLAGDNIDIIISREHIRFHGSGNHKDILYNIEFNGTSQECLHVPVIKQAITDFYFKDTPIKKHYIEITKIKDSTYFLVAKNLQKIPGSVNSNDINDLFAILRDEHGLIIGHVQDDYTKEITYTHHKNGTVKAIHPITTPKRQDEHVSAYNVSAPNFGSIRIEETRPEGHPVLNHEISIFVEREGEYEDIQKIKDVQETIKNFYLNAEKKGFEEFRK